jgi:hypothetical protein
MTLWASSAATELLRALVNALFLLLPMPIELLPKKMNTESQLFKRASGSNWRHATCEQIKQHKKSDRVAAQSKQNTVRKKSSTVDHPWATASPGGTGSPSLFHAPWPTQPEGSWSKYTVISL